MNVSEYVERLYASFGKAPRPDLAEITPHRCCGREVEALINYNLAASTDLDVGQRNRFAGFSEEERRVVLEFVEYRASLPDHIYDEPYLEAARSSWRER